MTEEVEGVGIEQDIPLDLYLQEFRRQGDLDALITFIECLPEDQAQERAAVQEFALALGKRRKEGDLGSYRARRARPRSIQSFPTPYPEPIHT